MSYIPNILVVDDEPQICESIRILLKRQGYDIHTTHSGADALKLLSSRPFDLLLLDMVIPDMSGFQIMDHMNTNGCETLTIVITGNASIESAVEALRKGAYDYLKKPFEYEELVKRVGNALHQRQLVHEKNIIGGKLERSEERYQYLVQNSPDIIYILDGSGNFIFVNITLSRLLGYTPYELKGQHFTTIVHKDDIGKAVNLLSDNPGRGQLPSARELRLVSHSDRSQFKLFEISNSIIPLSFGEGSFQELGIYGVARDISYNKQLEKQLRQAQKMEAVGTLAGGLAHDFNNILMGIMGYTSIMLSETGFEESHYAKLQSIEQYVRSGASLTRQLLGFARGGKYDVRPLDMNSIIKKTAGMFGRTKKEIAMQYSLCEQLWPAEGDEGQIEQVLMNLYMNAWQAMPCGGSLSIETGNTRIEPEHDQRIDLEPGSYVTITVRDTGTGMDEEVQQRIFEPFFTTKESERGTGLGLASAYGIIENHGGTITVESRKGQGSTFTIYLPASSRQVEHQAEADAAVRQGSERILLIDDEETMTAVGAELLEALGYTVQTAGSGAEGFVQFQKDPSAIDLVIVDLIMPGMNGGELCKKLREKKPGVKVLLSSGYSLNDETSKLLGTCCDGFIQKPFSLKEISHKLRELLDDKIRKL